MELKSFQQSVISDLKLYLEYLQRHKNCREAFDSFWLDKIGPYNPLEGLGMEPYKDTITSVPHVCIKVPTSGGKTFIACNALGTIFDGFDTDRTKLVVWLVPSVTILDQTLRNLRDPSHPYRQRLNLLFQNRVQVFSKDELLQGASFNPGSVKEHISVLVLSFDSLRAKSKDQRKLYQENGQLANFATSFGNAEHVLEGTDETAFINVVRKLEPVVIVDESHNAETELSIEMLKNLNPCFVLDLTATPRNNSNIISFVDALELKKEHMVKLPVIVYNHRQKEEVIASAIHLRNQLESMAIEEHKQTGKYIRPIVLFQAQPKTKDDSVTFEKIKAILLESKIPLEQIKIKTATTDEIKDEDLMSPECNVRYIITVNALKEGWDCPFAYILATLADRSSVVDVEQILGRVLRQPYVMQHNRDLLNMSYVLTSSAVFTDTLQNIVKGLNNAGFSEHDYKALDPTAQTQPNEIGKLLQLSQPLILADSESDYSIQDVSSKLDDKNFQKAFISELTSKAAESNLELKESIVKQEEDFLQGLYIPNELAMKTRSYQMKDTFLVSTRDVKIPQFFRSLPRGGLFSEEDESILVTREQLLEGFPLGTADATIDFNQTSTDLYKVDLERQKGSESTPTFLKIEDDRIRKPLLQYLRSLPAESQKRELVGRVMKLVGKWHPISDTELQRYINRIVEALNPEQYDELLEREYTYVDQIKKKIESLAKEYRKQMFTKYTDQDKIYIQGSYTLPSKITPTLLGPSLAKSLYEREGQINGFEQKVITEIANLENILWWHRNDENKGFFLNGFVNHYPDFIVMTKQGRILLVETKGDDRDNTDSENKLALGQLWASKAGSKFKYLMIFDHTVMQGAYTFDQALVHIKEL